MSQPSIEQVIDQVAHLFSQVDLHYGHGTGNAYDEAAWAVHHVLNLPFDLDEQAYQEQVSAEDHKMIQTLMRLRIQSRKPMAYLTHKMWFAGLEFYVDERTLVPRSPIAELILNEFSPWLDIDASSNVLDLCTGSGCIGLAIAHYFPHLHVTATDLSQDALDVAEINCQKLNLQDRVHLVQADLFDGLPTETYDLIISNPPYVPIDAISALPDEFQTEPEMGLVSGGDGLFHVQKILQNASNYLNDNGVLIVEVGLSADALSSAYPELPFMWFEFEHGGEGVFMLTAKQLKAFAKP
ncbi:MAG: 50S ribosomal protein L3 N(5)-glutamine methyltransferase [Gammaproteobacteria bacterium]|nr:50S ribosomal protein L3 N(5)-glutamine methyltransferase [Gammaproteobacteria bacterium]NNC96943.1 50S ribosomal protein L3 N(5)-glutamine methyltransferase [Gammaproteobacteria bacterium]